LLRERKGHFVYESGHHGDAWLELDLLFWEPDALRPLAQRLAERLGAHAPEAVCGPLNEGAFLALLIALEMGLPFGYAARQERPEGVIYRIPASQAAGFRGRRVAIVDDVVNAGSAAGSTLAALGKSGAIPVAIAALAVYGTAARDLASRGGLALETLAEFPRRAWSPDACPQCRQGLPLTATD
jgi:orotate phosphoribosyltransferase